MTVGESARMTLADLRRAAEAEAEEQAELARLEAEQKAREGRLGVTMEERVYGVIAALALHGAERPKVTVDGVEALRMVSRAEKGCATIADFGGTNVMMRLAHGANKTRIHKAKEDKRKGKGFFVGLKFSIRGKARDSPSADYRSMESAGSAGPGTGGGKPAGDSVSPRPPPVDQETCVAENALACIRNLACRSRERKEEILNSGGAQIAVKSMKVFAALDCEPVRKAAAGLLRNLSAEVHIGPPILLTAGLLAVAEDELSDIAECTDLQRHLLATVQNMAAHPDAPKAYFKDGASQRWMDVCADVVHHARNEGKAKLLQQALSALANLALVRANEEKQQAVDPAFSINLEQLGDVGNKDVSKDEDQSIKDSDTASKTRGDVTVSQDQESGDERIEGNDDSSVKESAPGSEALVIADGDSETVALRKPKTKMKTVKTVKIISKKKAPAAPTRKSYNTSGWGSSLGADDLAASKFSGWGTSFASDGEAKDSEKADDSKDEYAIVEEGGEEEEAEGDEEEEMEDAEEENGEGDEEEGGESEELEEDEVVEETSSLPTDALVFEASILAAQSKVPPAVLETMLQILGQEGSMQVSTLTAAATIAALCNFAQDVDVERSIGNLGGIELVLTAMANHRNSQVNLQGLRFLWNMSFSHHNQQRLMAADGLPLIFGALLAHRTESDGELQEQGNGVLRNLATGPARQKREIFHQGGVGVLCRTFVDYYSHQGACRQAAAAIRILADGAPPVAEEVCEVDGMRGLIHGLTATGDDSDLTDHILHAMELVLISPRATRPFCQAKGHLEVLNAMERFHNDNTALRACRTLAGALCQHEGFEEEELSESEAEQEKNEEEDDEEIQLHTLSKKELKELQKEREKLKEKKEKEKERKRNEQGPRVPSLRMRLQLLELSAVEKLFQTMETFKESLAVNEAVVGALRNLVMDIPNAPPALKPEAGDRSDMLLKCTARWSSDYANRRQAVRFVGLVLTLMCSLALNSKAATVLHRHGAGEKALEWMNMYSNDPVVQCAGCSFLKNFAASQLRIRQTIVEIGGVGQIADLLDRFIKNEDVLEEALRALHNLAMADGCGVEAAENLLVRRAFKVMDMHRTVPALNAVGFALLWNISTNNIVNMAIIAQDGIARSLTSIRKFPDTPNVIGSVGGMLRNLLAGDKGEEVARRLKNERGFLTMREALYKHRDHPMVVEQLLAVFSNVCVLAGIFLQMMVDEFMNKQEAKRLQTIMEIHAKSSPIQFQAFSLVGRLVAFNRELKPCFNPIVPHALQMLMAHRNTPVVDMVESVLEEIG